MTGTLAARAADRRLAYPLLLSIPFLIGIAALKGLTVEIDTFHGSDAHVYHLPTILQFSQRLDFEHYPAAQTPLYHLLFAAYGKLVGFELWKLRLLDVALSYAAILALYGLLLRRLERLQAFALALVVALSPYVLGPSFTLLTDNLALLFGLLALGCFETARAAAPAADSLDRRRARQARVGPLTAFCLGCLAMSAAILTRQSFLWLALVAAWAFVRGPFSLRDRAVALAVAILALAPFAALVAVWDGLVPPGADPASCGLCTEHPGVGRDALTLRTVGFTLAVFGLYATVVYLPVVARRLRLGSPPAAALVSGKRSAPGSSAVLGHRPELARRLRSLRISPAVLLAPLAGVVLLLVSPLAYIQPLPGRPADAGYLWKAADHLPELAGSSLAFWVLVPLGVAALTLLVARAGLDTLPTVWFAAFLVAALPVALVYQKYFDPFALLALALFMRPPDLRRPLDYAGLALLGAAFVGYALTGGG